MIFVQVNKCGIPQITISFKNIELYTLFYDQRIVDMYKLPLLLLEAAVQQLSSLYWELSRFSPKSLLRDLERPNIRKKIIG